MDRRFQVFVSSTYTDLISERKAVMQAVLELGHMPAGMELFPATNESAWELIQGIIAESDFYIVIVGGRYGSTDDNDLSFTEREYEYAREKGVPVIALLRSNPEKIPRDKTDMNDDAWERLIAFRTKLESNHARKAWTEAENLVSAAVLSLSYQMKREKRSGWIRADQVPSNADIAEVLRLRDEVASLKSQLESSLAGPPSSAADLASGDDLQVYNVWIEYRHPEASETVRIPGSISIAWDALFSVSSLRIQAGLPHDVLHDFLSGVISSWAQGQSKTFDPSDIPAFKAAHDEGHTGFYSDAGLPIAVDDAEWEVASATASAIEVETCILQFRALGLITEVRNSVGPAGAAQTHWTLTPYGLQRMIELRAIRKGQTDEALPEDPA